MKLSFAVAAIISQTFPSVASEKKPSAHWLEIDDSSNKNRRDDGAKKKDNLSLLALVDHSSSPVTTNTNNKISDQIDHKTYQRQQLVNNPSTASLSGEEEDDASNSTFFLFANQERKKCDPSSTDPDIGILACPTGSRCLPSKTSSLGGECLQQSGKKKINTSTECVPINTTTTTDEVNIGSMESCGSGYQCFESEESSLGGFCESSSSPLTTAPHRQLQQLPVWPCDLSYINPDRYYGCADICRGGNEGPNYTRVGDEIVALQYCYSFFTVGDDSMTTSSTICVEFNDDYSSCEVKFEGELCNTCNVSGRGCGRSYWFDYFDCTNLMDGFTSGPVIEDQCTTFRNMPIFQDCYRPVNGESDQGGSTETAEPTTDLSPDVANAADSGVRGVKASFWTGMAALVLSGVSTAIWGFSDCE